jgi:hypothetical protein
VNCAYPGVVYANEYLWYISSGEDIEYNFLAGGLFESEDDVSYTGGEEALFIFIDDGIDLNFDIPVSEFEWIDGRYKAVYVFIGTDSEVTVNTHDSLEDIGENILISNFSDFAPSGSAPELWALFAPDADPGDDYIMNDIESIIRYFYNTTIQHINDEFDIDLLESEYIEDIIDSLKSDDFKFTSFKLLEYR